MKRFRIILLFISLIAISCGDSTNSSSNANIPSELKISWVFEEKGESDMGQPIVDCFLQINDKKVLVFERLRETCSELTADTYAQFQIPRTASSAFSSWWAGAGSYVYTQQQDGKIVVMRCFVDEGMTGDVTYKFESVKEIDLSELFK